MKNVVNPEVKYVKLFNKKGIPIFLALLTLLTLLSMIPACVLADDQKMPPTSGSGESFDQMKARMTESVNITIENLNSSKVNLDNESTLEAAEKLITDLKSIQVELSNANTEDDLIKIRQELTTLFNAASDELKTTPGLLHSNVGQGPNMQNISGNFSQDFKNMPEMMNNGTQPPGMMNNETQPPGMEEKDNSSNLTAVSANEKAADSDIFGNLLRDFINTLKSLYVTD
jgi:hypothetical protein